MINTIALCAPSISFVNLLLIVQRSVIHLKGLQRITFEARTNFIEASIVTLSWIFQKLKKNKEEKMQSNTISFLVVSSPRNVSNEPKRTTSREKM